MAIILYKCDVCKREVELKQNKTGLETMQRCIVTQGCRGKLYQTRVLQDYIRGSLPDGVVGLDDYQQRKVLYNHTQSIASEQWLITHDLGTAPVVSTYVDRNNDKVEVTPQDIITVDPDTTKVVFDRPESGIAQMVARASDPQILQPFVREEEEQLEIIPVTTNTELTIASRTSAPDDEPSQISIELNYTTTDGINVPITYAADDQPAAASPWNSFNKIVLNGKVFTIRSFNIVVAQQVTGVITNGSTVRISRVDTGSGFRDLNDNELVILLAKEPYENVDKITNQYIDAFDVSDSINPFALFFDSGELIADETIIQNTHPPIRSI